MGQGWSIERVWGRIAVACGTILLAAGVLTSSVNAEEYSKSSLAREGKGVALMTAWADGGGCRVAALILGVPEKGRFRHIKGLVVRHAERAPVADVKLNAGKYHIIGIQCVNGRKFARLGVPTGDGGVTYYDKSYATFTVQRGEIVNIGALRVGELGEAAGTANRTIMVKLAVSDWTPNIKATFKRQRPSVYAQMRTRLMRLSASASKR